jgi:hypothetical protein
MSDVQVIIENNEGAEVFNGTSVDGKIRTELVKHREDSGSSNDYLYFDVTATKGDLTVTRRFRSGITYTNFPFFVIAGGSGGSGGSGDCCLDDIQNKLDALQNNLIAANETKKTEILDAISSSTGDIIQNIDNSINDSHDRYVVHANRNRDSIIDITINGDGNSVNNQDLMDIAQNNNTILNSMMEFIIDSNHKISSLLKRWVKGGY